MISRKLEFEGSQGATLAALLDLPVSKPRAYAIFAHCFTCSKDLNATRRIANALAAEGIAVLRFDFTGLGASGGEFASTNFSSNIADLLVAAEYLRQNHEAPQLLVGHSLGGAAVLAAAAAIPEVKAVATIGAPADAGHVVHNFGAKLDEIAERGAAEVSLAGRTFTIAKQFLDDLEQSAVKDRIASMKKALLVLHSPLDQIVGIENASEIFLAARHPKSFVSLDTADHLLTRDADARFVASTIATWCARYIANDAASEESGDDHPGVSVSETGNGKFQNLVSAGRHGFFADEPESYGGTNTGPTPYDLLSAALGACTTMTLRMYAGRKGASVPPITVRVEHEKIHARDCEECSQEQRDAGGRIDNFHRTIEIDSSVDPEFREKLLEIADKCPVHRTLHASSRITTEVDDGKS